MATPAASKAVKSKATGPRPMVGSVAEPSSGSRDALIGRKLQEYVIESRLGVGGMGVVYKAVQPMIGKHVAIKVLRPDVVQDPRDMDRLLEEARVVSSIKHRGIINIFGAGTLDDGRHYLIMELLEGESLEQLMAREGIIPAGDTVLILEQTLSALAAAHEAGIVHRDLKPANIFIAREAGQMYVKLLDFGLARRQSQNVTRIAGTPDYISPEHARGRPAGPPADLYAFGVLCFHMLTGQLPFTGNSPMEVMEKHVHQVPPVPHEEQPSIPRALSELILKLLSKEPGERPDATQVKADLRAATRQIRAAPTMMSLMAVEPVSDVPDDVVKREKELARSARVNDLKRQVNRRWPMLLIGGAGAFLAAVLVYMVWPTPKHQPLVVKRPKEVLTKPVVDSPPDLPAVTPPVEPLGTSDEVDAGEAPGPALVAIAQVDAAVDAEDAGVVEENMDEVLDDVKIGEIRRNEGGINDKLGEIEVAIKNDAALRDLLGVLAGKARKQCDTAQTRRQLMDCQDQVFVLYGKYLKNVAP